MVTLRAKKRANGKFHLFIDTYDNGQRIKEYLKLYVSEDYTQPQSDKHGTIIFDSKGQPKERKPKPQDREIWELAKNIRLKRELALKSGEFGFTPAFKQNANFTPYFAKYVEQYNNKDRRKAVACLAKFNEFNGNKNIPCNVISEDYANAFKDFLETKLTGETPGNYFKVFKAAIKKAHKEGLLKTNFAEDIKIKKINAIRKDILNFVEIQKLNNTRANNPEVKRSFLFACLTGVRFGDIIKLTWNNIKETESGLMLSFTQSKTSKPVQTNLNEDAQRLLGKPGAAKDFLFKLPSHTGVLKGLRSWTKQAGVKKKVTFHVARHSFATNLIFYGADLKTASTLLGHSRLEQTNLYAREVESLKQQAVYQLPKFSVSG